MHSAKSSNCLIVKYLNILEMNVLSFITLSCFNVMHFLIKELTFNLDIYYKIQRINV